eukprot:sb/3476313/
MLFRHFLLTKWGDPPLDDDDDDKIDFDMMLVNPDDETDKSQGIVIIKMRESSEDQPDVGVLCNAGAGRNEANAMCRYFGSKYGMFIDPFSFKAVSAKKESVYSELPFFATDLSCPSSE